MTAPKAIDLFSGCGGLTLGLRLAGFKVVGAIEVDALAVKTYRANHRRVRIWDEDITQVPIAAVLRELKLRRGELDLLAGCPPCQGFSTMTTRNGRHKFNDPRNDLVFQFLRFVRGLQPKAVMIENVPALATDKRINRIVENLELMGYRITKAVLDAADYGVPQRRRRFILIAGRGRTIPFGRRADRPSTVRAAFKQLSKQVKADPLHKLPETRSEKVKALIRLIPKDGGSRTDLSKKYQLNCHKKCDGFKDVYGRMSWDKVSPTITGGCCNPSKGRFLHPTKNRSITLREAALLQTFPPDYVFSIERGKFQTAQMIGNALPPEFIRRHAAEIRKSLSL